MCILNGKQVPYREENIVRKGEIACNKQFLLFSQCFPTAIYLLCQNAVFCDNGLIKAHPITVATKKFFVSELLLLHNLRIFVEVKSSDIQIGDLLGN